MIDRTAQNRIAAGLRDLYPEPSCEDLPKELCDLLARLVAVEVPRSVVSRAEPDQLSVGRAE